MPELPEVEIVVRSLNSLLSGRGINTAELIRERLAPDSPPAEFAYRVSGAGINFVGRRGKHILFDLANGQTLITHLRMSGRFMLLRPDSENPKFTHAIFYLDDDSRLIFQDQRHFGLMKIVETAGLHSSRELAKLAPEPFSEDFSYEYFRAVLRDSRRSLKEVLIDQTKVCGLGNIYASEAMFLAKANPAVQANALSSRKAAALFESIRAVLCEAISHGSALPIDPENIERGFYSSGSDSAWRVYGREAEPCPNCETPIARIKQGGRSTYFCGRCQRK
jgi:formamidopyrimidine-DNA glycosylase